MSYFKISHFKKDVIFFSTGARCRYGTWRVEACFRNVILPVYLPTFWVFPPLSPETPLSLHIPLWECNTVLAGTETPDDRYSPWNLLNITLISLHKAGNSRHLWNFKRYLWSTLKWSRRLEIIVFASFVLSFKRLHFLPLVLDPDWTNSSHSEDVTYLVSCEPLRIFWNDDTTCSTWVTCLLPTAGLIPCFSACRGQNAWHSCRAGCFVISENPQGLATDKVQSRVGM